MEGAEELVRNMFLNRLRVLGPNKIKASGGEAGGRIFQAQSNEIDLLIMDLGMPKMNGVEAFEELIRTNRDAKVLL